MKNKLIKVNNYIKDNNYKLPSKDLSKILLRRFQIDDKAES